jgi:Obg family GTPase CgtA-like protein
VLLYAIAGAVADIRAAQTPRAGQAWEAATVAEPEAPIEVVRDAAGWRVLGDRPARWVAMADLDNPDAVAFLQRRLRRAGVDDLLAEAGAEPGDEVLVGETAFEYEPDALADPPERRGPRRR